MTRAEAQSLKPKALVGEQRAAFDVPDEIAYFNTANIAPQLHRVREAGNAALARRARPWKIAPDDWFVDVDRLRSSFGRIVGGSADGVALVPATSYGFATAARNLPLRTGDRVLVLAGEYPSGVYTWRAATHAAGAEIITASREAGQTWTEAVLAELDERVAVVSVPNVHWTDGTLIDLHAVADRTRELGARLVIDGSQSVGAMPIDVATLQPDFLVSVGYKWLLGPFSVSYLYVAEHHREGVPIEQNWISRRDAEDFARLIDYRDDYQPGARRFDAGQRTNFELIPMALAALDQILGWGVRGIAEFLATVNETISSGCADLGLAAAPSDRRGPHLLGVSLPEPIRGQTLETLESAGCFTAIRGGSLRIAPHLHTTSSDVSRLLAALSNVCDNCR